MKRAPLGEICSFVSGGTPSRDRPEFFEGSIPWITGADVQGDVVDVARSFITKEAVAASATSVVEAGTVLLVTRTGVGKAAIAGADLAFSQDITALFPDESRVDKRFLLRALLNESPRFKALSQGATIKGITRKMVEETSVMLPPLEEQKRIASILDAADELRTKRQQAIDQLDTLTQAIFYDMFGDPIANDRGWDRKPLAGISRGIYDCPHSTPEWTEQGEICLRTPNLGTGMWDWTDTRYVSNETFEERSKRAYLEAGDIVLSREGTVGVAAMVQPEMRMCMGQRLVQIQPDHEQVASPFLLAVLLFLLKPERIARVMAGSTVKHLNVKDLRDLEVIVPPKGQQESYVVASDAVERKREVIGSASTQLETLFSSLQQRAFRGDL